MSHYNNIFNKKNVEFSLEEKSDKLPYSYSEDVELKTNQILFNPVNDAFQKLLDNDLYNEALLKQYIEEGGEGVGPTFVSSMNSVLDSADENSKFIVSGEDGISVVHKAKALLSETLSGRFLNGKDIRKIGFIDDSFYAVASDGIYSSSNKRDWNQALSIEESIELIDACYNYGYLADSASLISSFDLIAVGKDSDGMKLFGHDGNSGSWKRFDEDSKLSQFEMKDIEPTKVFSVEGDSKLYFGAKDSGLYGFYGHIGETPIKENGTDNWTVNDVAKIERENPREDYLLATNYGIKQSRQSVGFLSPKKTVQLNREEFPYDALKEHTAVYVAASRGLHRVSQDGTKTEIPDLSGIACYSLVKHQSKIYVGTSDGIYQLEGNSAMKLTDGVVFKLISFNNKLYVQEYGANSDVLAYYADSNFSIRYTISLSNKGKRIRQFLVHSNALYVVTDECIFKITSGRIQTITAFVQQSGFFARKNLQFAKALGKTDAIVQINTNSGKKIYSLSGVSETPTEITSAPTSLIYDVSKIGSEYMFASGVSQKHLYIGSADTGIIVDKAVYIDSAEGNAAISGILYSNDSGLFLSNSIDVFSVRNTATNDIVSFQNKIYSIDGSGINKYSPSFTVALRPINSSFNVEDTSRYKIDKIEDEGQPVLSVEEISIVADRNSISTSTGAFIDFSEDADLSGNLAAVDYVGYAAEGSTKKHFLIASFPSNNKVSYYAVDGSSANEITAASGRYYCFADAYSFDSKTSNLISGLNAVVSSYNGNSGLYFKKTVPWFYIEEDGYSFKDGLVSNGRMFAISSSEDLLLIDKKNGNKSLLSTACANKLVSIDGDVVVCEDNGIESIDSTTLMLNEESKYLPPSIKSLFLSSDTTYDISADDFAKISVEVDSIDFSSSTASSVFKNKESLTAAGDLTSASDVAFFYKKQNGLIAEDVYGYGYSATVNSSTKTISFARIADYQSVRGSLSSASNSMLAGKGLTASYSMEDSVDYTIVSPTFSTIDPPGSSLSTISGISISPSATYSSSIGHISLSASDIDGDPMSLAFLTSWTLTSYLTASTNNSLQSPESFDATLSVKLSYIDGWLSSEIDNLIVIDLGNPFETADSNSFLSSEFSFFRTERILSGSEISVDLFCALSNGGSDTVAIDLTSNFDGGQGQNLLGNGAFGDLPVLHQKSYAIPDSRVAYELTDTSEISEICLSGFFLTTSSVPNKIVGYTLDNRFFLFDGFNVDSAYKACGCVLVNKTDFSVLSNNLAEIEAGSDVPYEEGIADYKNQSFKDFFYYIIDGGDTILLPHYPGSPFSNKTEDLTDYDAFFKSSLAGSATCLKTFDDALFVGTLSGLLSATKAEFPYLKKVSSITDRVYALYADSNYLYVETANTVETIRKNLFSLGPRVSKNGAKVIESDGRAYFVNESSLSVLGSDENLHSEQIKGISLVEISNVLGYLSSDDSYYYSPMLLETDCVKVAKQAFSLDDGYEKAAGRLGIVDAKTIEIDGSDYLFECYPSSIKATLLSSPAALEAENSQNVLSGLISATTFGFTPNGSLMVLDGTTLYCSQNTITAYDGIVSQIQLSDCFVKEQAVSAGESVKFNSTKRLDESEYSIGISEDKHYLVDSTYSLIESRAFNGEGLERFYADYDSSKLYAIGTLFVVKNDDGVWIARNLPVAIEPKMVAIEEDKILWSLSSNDGRSPLCVDIDARIAQAVEIKNDASTSDIFKLNGETYYATNKGIYALMTIDEGDMSSSTALFGSSGKDVYALEFLSDGEDKYVYNYLSSCIVAGYPSYIDKQISADVISTFVRMSLFSSSSDDLLSSIAKGYQTTERMTAIDRFGSKVLFTNGADGFVYDLDSKEGSKITLDQLDGINGRKSMLMFLKDAGGTSRLMGYGNSVASTAGLDETVRLFREPADDLLILGTNFRSGTNTIVPVKKDEDFLIGSSFGLKYVYDKKLTSSFYSSEDRSLRLNGNVKLIAKVYSSEDDSCYLVAQGSSLYEVTDLNAGLFKKVLELKEDEEITDILCIQKNEYVVATTKGVYLTSNSYKIANDLTRFTIESVYGMIDEELAKAIKKHIEEDHAEDSFITRLNKKADAKVSFISSEDKHVDRYDYSIANGIRVVENDAIESIERAGETSEGETYVKVAFKNWATAAIETESFYSDNGFVSKFVDPSSGKTFDVSRVPYIVKNWKSGIKEIYVYVPSTATYYINNPVGVSNSLYAYNQISRRNVPGVSNTNSLPDCCTQLRIYLYNSHFGIKSILAAQCVGNSLPLKIYKDSVNEDDSWKGFFDTVMQPSALRTLPRTSDGSVNNVRICTDSLDRVYLDFSVYGTDAQAIRIVVES